ncbi:helix-turn-helix domain-containing protein [Arthrobacter sp. Rue61a]|jgi:transposase|uniref:helix-turn-helix domain-containing protein n=1 Tax=Arthrobacter sp. Rue61a TaxID=1118963 RepID=UPI0002FA631A|nr:helix-turn-helix domain-containing protein [Arthrobacter sp. Rue61a]
MPRLRKPSGAAIQRLAEVTAASQAKQAAENEYLRIIVAAAAEGVRKSQIAEAAGVSRQTVDQIVNRYGGRGDTGKPSH